MSALVERIGVEQAVVASRHSTGHSVGLPVSSRHIRMIQRTKEYRSQISENTWCGIRLTRRYSGTRAGVMLKLIAVFVLLAVACGPSAVGDSNSTTAIPEDQPLLRGAEVVLLVQAHLKATSLLGACTGDNEPPILFKKWPDEYLMLMQEPISETRDRTLAEFVDQYIFENELLHLEPRKSGVSRYVFFESRYEGNGDWIVTNDLCEFVVDDATGRVTKV